MLLLASFVYEWMLCLLKRARNLPELQGVAIADGRGDVGIQAFAVEAAKVGAAKVGQLIGAADMLKRGMAA